jgi:hypothetical protein
MRCLTQRSRKGAFKGSLSMRTFTGVPKKLTRRMAAAKESHSRWVPSSNSPDALLGHPAFFRTRSLAEAPESSSSRMRSRSRSIFSCSRSVFASASGA